MLIVFRLALNSYSSCLSLSSTWDNSMSEHEQTHLDFIVFYFLRPPFFALAV
jgi:hypothetical protein